MLLLGFKEAADPVAMTCLLQDIDEDRTGTITEGGFQATGSTGTRMRYDSSLLSLQESSWRFLQLKIEEVLLNV